MIQNNIPDYFIDYGTVVISDKIARESMDHMTLNERRITRYLINRAQLMNKYNTVSITVSEVLDVIQVKRNGKSYTNINNLFLNLQKRAFFVINKPRKRGRSKLCETEMPQTKKIIYMFSDAVLGKNEITLTWNAEFIQYIQNPKGHCARYALYFYNILSSTYAQRIYELGKSIQKYKPIREQVQKMSIDDLKYILLGEDASTLKWSKFNQTILEPAIKKCNQTDICVGIVPIKKGNHVIGVELNVTSQEDVYKEYVEYQKTYRLIKLN